MEGKGGYGMVFAAIGGIGIIGGSELNSMEVMMVGAAAFAVGIFLVYMDVRKWYCAACGQFLGRGDRPSRCERCGSNRVTTEDPGAGDAVRVRR